MPRASIDYLNARRELGAGVRKGKTIFSKASALVDSRAQHAGLDSWERTMTAVDAIQAEFRSWANNQRPVSAIAGGDDDDWF